MLLMSPRLPALVQTLSQHFDLLLFDGPPAQSTRDVDVLASHADVITVVARQGVSQQRSLRDLVQNLTEQGRGTPLGIILNGVRSRHLGSSYYYRGSRSLAESWYQGVWRWVRQLVQGIGDRPTPSSAVEGRTIGLYEAAERLGVRPSIVRRWVRQGRLPAIREGWFWHVREDDLRIMIDHQLDGEEGTSLRSLEKRGGSSPDDSAFEKDSDEETLHPLSAVFARLRRSKLDR
jgi:excisionase family DNA binding protein